MEDKKHGKVIDKILSFPSVVSDFEYWYTSDIRRRNGYVVGDGRVYGWLDADDVLNECVKLELSPREMVLVRSEFGEDKLNDIWHHCCEVESDQYVDWRGGCAHTDYRKRVRLYEKWLSYQREDCTSCYLEQESKNNKSELVRVWSWMKYHHEEFERFNSKNWTPKQVWDYYYKNHKQEIEQRDLLEFLGTDTRNIWGGKYPLIVDEDVVCLHEEDEVSSLVEYIEEAQKELTNKKFYDVLCGRDQRWTNYGSAKEVLDQIDYWTEKFEMAQKAVKFVEEYIKSTTKAWKEILLERLNQEITDFLEYNFSLEERIEQNLAKFDTLVEFKNGEAITNQGAHAPLDQIKEVITDFHRGLDVVGRKLGHYTINRIIEHQGESYFKVGCHLFHLKEVELKLPA